VISTETAAVELNFNEWFYSESTNPYYEAQLFYEDCSEEDLKTRESLMFKWIRAAYIEGYSKATTSVS
jgi:hypothetical protein